MYRFKLLGIRHFAFDLTCSNNNLTQEIINETRIIQILFDPALIFAFVWISEVHFEFAEALVCSRGQQLPSVNYST